MTGPEHYAEAERLLREVGPDHSDDTLLEIAASVIIERAQVHAMLALTAVCWTGLSHGYDIYKQWERVIDPGRYDEVTR